jgi:prepilin-type N-terminal cleavage/methylation domain-containing protein
MKTKPPINRAPSVLRRAFTMVEILAVIAVIAILMSVAAVGVQRMDEGQATAAAVSVTEAIFDEARSAAIGRGTRARVVLHNDSSPDQRDRYLRFLAVAIEKDGNWEFDSRGTTLPSGVYYDKLATDEAGSKISDIGTYGTMSIALPGDKRNEVNCYYWEFNSEGLCVDADNPGSPGAPFVLAGGVLPPNEDTPRVKGNNRTGFVVWRNGRTSIFRNPEHITSGN